MRRPSRESGRRFVLGLALTTTVACGGAPTASAPVAANRAATAGGTTSVADVRLELLKTAPADLPSSSRNPFQFQARVAPASAAPRGIGARRGAPVPVAAGTAPAPVVVGPPPVPAIALRFIGVADTDRGRVAMLKDPGGDILSGREGDIIDGRYRLLRVGPDSADLAYVDGRGRQTIRLSGQ